MAAKRQATCRAPVMALTLTRPPLPKSAAQSLSVVSLGPVEEEIADGLGYLGSVRLERKVPGIQESYDRAGNVALECLGAGGKEERIVPAPDREEGRSMSPEI